MLFCVVVATMAAFNFNLVFFVVIEDKIGDEIAARFCNLKKCLCFLE
jgi:hypothetical protein